MAESNENAVTPLAAKGFGRWRFSLSTLFWGIALIAIALFLYREGPDLLRRHYYNDPLPLHIPDKSKICIRQIPYLPMNQFAYRIYLPPGRSYDICAAEAKDGESIPEPKGYSIYTNPGGMELRITGLDYYSSSPPKEDRFVLGKATANSSGVMGFQTKEFSHPKHDGTTVTWRDRGLREVTVHDPDKVLVVYRKWWLPEGSLPSETYDPSMPGAGVVVWIRPSRP